MEEDAVADSVIEEFFGHLDLLQNNIVQMKVESKCHVHWWDGWKDEDNLATSVDTKSERPERGKSEKKKMVSSPSPRLGRCFSCRESGHWARDCKSEDLKNKCHECKERGHIKRNCLKLFSQINKAEVEQIEEMEIDVIPVVKIEHDDASIGLDINCPCTEFGIPLVSLSSEAAETIPLTIGLKRRLDLFNEERDSSLRNKKRRFERLEYEGKVLPSVGSELFKAAVKVEVKERVLYIDQEEGQEVWCLSPTQLAINTTPGGMYSTRSKGEGRANDSSGAPYASHRSSHDADCETSIISSPLPDMLALIDLPNKQGNVDRAGQYAHDSSWHASGQDTMLGDWAPMCFAEVRSQWTPTAGVFHPDTSLQKSQTGYNRPNVVYGACVFGLTPPCLEGKRVLQMSRGRTQEDDMFVNATQALTGENKKIGHTNEEHILEAVSSMRTVLGDFEHGDKSQHSVVASHDKGKTVESVQAPFVEHCLHTQVVHATPHEHVRSIEQSSHTKAAGASQLGLRELAGIMGKLWKKQMKIVLYALDLRHRSLGEGGHGERVPFLFLAHALDLISNESGRIGIMEILSNVLVHKIRDLLTSATPAHEGAVNVFYSFGSDVWRHDRLMEDVSPLFSKGVERLIVGIMNVVDPYVDETKIYFESAETGRCDHGFMGEFAPVKFGGEDIYDSALTWRRLIRTVLEQSLAKLRSSQGLVLL